MLNISNNSKNEIVILFRFFVLTYIISWSFWIPMLILQQEIQILQIIGTFGPTMSALLLTWYDARQKGVAKLLQGLRIWRVGVRWYLFSLFSTALFVILAISIYIGIGNPVPLFNDPAQWYLIIIIFFYVLIFSVSGEEIGWRGYALPRLLTRQNALVSSIILGVIWSFWHLPLFFIVGNFHQNIPIALFLIQSVALAIVYTWLYNNTEGSLLIASFFHAASNTTLGILPVLPMDTDGNPLALWITVILLCVFAVILVRRCGSENLTRTANEIYDFMINNQPIGHRMRDQLVL